MPTATATATVTNKDAKVVSPVKVVKPTVQEKTYKKGKITAKYPQFKGISDATVEKKINQTIRSTVKNFINDCKRDKYLKEAIISYKTHYLTPDKLSFELSLYVYSGGAHGSTRVEGYSYDLATGNRYSFSNTYSYKNSEINAKIFQQSREQNIPLFEDFKGITDYPDNFYLNNEGRPVIIFQQYEIAPYSSGIIRIRME